MKSTHAWWNCRVVAVGAVAMLASAHASVTVYTSEPSFTSQLYPGYYLEDFSSILMGLLPSPQTFSGGTPVFSYEASAPSGLYGISPTGFSPALSVNDSAEALTISFTGADVRAVGGNFFATDWAGDMASGSVTVKLSDGSTYLASFPPMAFMGFVANGGTVITSVEIISNGLDWPAADHLFVGVPEPKQYALVAGLGLAALTAFRRCRRS